MMTTDNTRSLIDWKTRAWQDPAMVAWYSGRMTENTGTDQLKNRLEIDLCTQYACGDRILDVGIGTGRASLPLAASGKTVAGIDSSQAMLDECARLASAQGLQLDLRRADVERLPFADADFDTLLSLNVLVHFPHWLQILPEWARVIRPGGRLIFDVHSLDNMRAALGREVSEDELKDVASGNYMLRVATEDLLAACTEQGLALVALVPYGAFLGGGNRNYLLGELEDRFYWRRFLSWVAKDKALFDFALFLEQRLVSRLSPMVSGRFMVVLEKRVDSAHNAACLESIRRMDEQLRQNPLNLQAIATLAGVSLPELRHELAAQLDGALRPRRLLELLMTAATGRLSPRELLTPDWARRFENIAARRTQDRRVADLAASIYTATPAVSAALVSEGVALGEGMEYFLVEKILTRALRSFTGVRS